jgi:hypothetical protein
MPKSALTAAAMPSYPRRCLLQASDGTWCELRIASLEYSQDMRAPILGFDGARSGFQGSNVMRVRLEGYLESMQQIDIESIPQIETPESAKSSAAIAPKPESPKSPVDPSLQRFAELEAIDDKR